MPRFHSLILISLLTTVVVATSGIATTFAQDEPSTPVAVDTSATEPSLTSVSDGAATPGTGPASAASPAAPQLSAEECALIEPTHFEEQKLSADLQIALNEAGIGAGVADLEGVGLTAEAARELATLETDASAALDELDVPAFYQEANDAFVTLGNDFAAGLNDYAAAVDAGADPDAALEALFTSLEPIAAEAVRPITELRSACPPQLIDSDDDRELADLLDIAAQLQTDADVPAAVQETNDALIAFLAAFSSGLREFAGRVDAGEDPAAVSAELEADVQPIAMEADRLMRTFLEGCGVPVGLQSIDSGRNPELSDSDCQEIFSWYRETAERFTDLNALLLKQLYILPQNGIALPGYLGSVDPNTLGATPAGRVASPTATAPGTGSPVAAPQLSRQECAQYVKYDQPNLQHEINLFIVLRESGIAQAPPFDPARVTLTPAIARETAAVIQASIDVEAASDVPPVAQALSDASISVFSTLARLLIEYADSVDAGAAPQTAFETLFSEFGANPDVNRPAELSEGIVRACALYPDARDARQTADRADEAIQAQAEADAPAVVAEARQALLDYLTALSAALTAYADAVEAGDDPIEAVPAKIGPSASSGTQPDTLLRGLLERCGIEIGLLSISTSDPPLSAAECDDVFAWYEATAKRLQQVNKQLLKMRLDYYSLGVALPGGSGSVDLDER